MSEVDFFYQHGLAQTSPLPLGIQIEKAEGSYFFDTHGKAYLDFISGIGVSNLGHGHPSIKKAIQEQSERHLHVMVYGEFLQKAQSDFAKALQATLPKTLDCYYVVNSGTEAIEAAMKLAKRSTGRSKLISFKGAYHGSTQGALSLGSNEYKKQAYRPLIPNIDFIALNEVAQLQKIDEHTAAVFLETIQGDAGIRIPDTAYMKALRKRCDEVGALLVLDEIQCGMGRTGKMWAFEHYDIVPDILCMGKALGGGLPIGCLAANQSLMKLFSNDPPLGHITTFGGHPLPCAAAAAGLGVFQEEAILAGIAAKAQRISALLQHPQIVELRQIGLFIAVELKDEHAVNQVVSNCLERGVLLFWFLSTPNAFRIAPPLNISMEDIEFACEVILEELGRN